MIEVSTPTGNNIITNVHGDDWNRLLDKWSKKTKTGSTISLVHFINLRADLGYSALLPSNKYRLHKAYSNSRLGVIKTEMMGRKWTGAKRAFVVGTAFHELILEPENACAIEDYMLTPSEETQVRRMVIAAQRNEDIMALRYTGEAEKEFYWKDYALGVPCKAKTDLWIGRTSTIVDLKSTISRTQEQFEAACKKYEYDRQGVFYLDGAKARTVIFIGVSKIKPYNIFFYSFRRTQKVANVARKKYRFILGKAQELNIEP